MSARFYDVTSLERPVYRAGREAGIAAMALHAGDRVLDTGCGTGLNFPLLRSGVGASGMIVGLDTSAAMLRQARSRIRRHGWVNVTTVLGDAAGESVDVGGPFDALLFTCPPGTGLPAWCCSAPFSRSAGPPAAG